MKKNVEGQVLKIFPTEIFLFQCSDQDLINNTLLNLNKEDWRNMEKNSRCHQTICNRLDQKKEFKELYDWFQICLVGVSKFLKLKCDNIQITLSWANKAFESEKLPDHKFLLYLKPHDYRKKSFSQSYEFL